MIDVAALQSLRSVAALGTLARAADELGFTASAVSQQIKRLERQLGVQVLAPSGRGVVLTPAGRALVDSMPDVFDALERCEEAARSVAEGAPRGTVRVAAFSTAIRGLLAPVLHRFTADYPDVVVLITEQDPDKALHSVDAGTADVALIHDADGLPAPLPVPSMVSAGGRRARRSTRRSPPRRRFLQPTGVGGVDRFRRPHSATGSPTVG